MVINGKSQSCRSPRGNERTCQTWAAEAAFRLIQNNLDPAVAEDPDNLIVYGGIGKAARNWDCFEAIVASLIHLGPAETLLVQSGKPVGILPSHSDAPRVLIANSNIVPRWATWENFHELDRLGLIMFGQMTAGSWIYIGTQGILQGTYETFAACGRKHFGEGSAPLTGRLVVSAGLGGMGGAQPLAATLAGAAFLAADIDIERIRRRANAGYLDEIAPSVDDAIRCAFEYRDLREAKSIGVVANASELLERLLELQLVPDVVTDQTSAHDPLNGYLPTGLTQQQAMELRRSDPAAMIRLAKEGMGRHVELLLEMKSRGAVVFDYGNNIRAAAFEAGISEAFTIPGFVPEYIRPLFCQGSGPFRYVALSGDPEDIAAADAALLRLFPENYTLKNWLLHGARRVTFQGLPARICWLRHREREIAGVVINSLVRDGIISAPLAIGRDHLDAGSVASPYRETEGMLDGSDAISDWVFLNAMVNAVNGASWVSVHHGGGVGMGYSQHAGMVVVADGTADAERRLKRVLNSDPATGVLRHADAGYSQAVKWARKNDITIPMLDATKWKR